MSFNVGFGEQDESYPDLWRGGQQKLPIFAQPQDSGFEQQLHRAAVAWDAIA